MLNCMLVGAGGFLGAVCRYLIGLIPVEAGGSFPIKTLFINVCGAFAIGLIAAIAAKHQADHSHLVLMLKVGVCGGFTTFSTFAFETSDLIRQGHTAAALAYVMLSVVLGVAAVFLSQLLVR